MLPLAVFAFIRHPHVSSCSSGYVCDCIEQPHFAGWYDDFCKAGSGGINTTNATAASAEFSAAGSDMFASIDPLTIVVAVLTGIAMLTLIALSVLFARYRKRTHAVASMQVELHRVQSKFKVSEEEHEQARRLIQEQLCGGGEGEERFDVAMSHFAVKHSDLELHETPLGEGSYGLVRRATLHGQTVAVKTLRVAKVDSGVLCECPRRVLLSI